MHKSQTARELPEWAYVFWVCNHTSPLYFKLNQNQVSFALFTLWIPASLTNWWPSLPEELLNHFKQSPTLFPLHGTPIHKLPCFDQLQGTNTWLLQKPVIMAPQWREASSSLRPLTSSEYSMNVSIQRSFYHTQHYTWSPYYITPSIPFTPN